MLETSIRHFTRYSEVISILIRHGMGMFISQGYPVLQQDTNLCLIGRHLREALVELGPTFIKLGQLASTRPDIVPPPVQRELSLLQDQVQPILFQEVRQIVEEALGARLETLFRDFRTEPIAAASIAQVHYAVLKNGDPVAVKVQRPFLQPRVKTDLEIFQNLVGQIEQRSEWGKRYPVRIMFEEFSKKIQEELDFLIEGRNTEKIAKGMKKFSYIRIPKVYWEFSNSRVLTLQYISGIRLSQLTRRQDSNYNPQKVADRLSKALLQQILVEGYFHGDPHAGNILVLPEDRIALLDFGIMGELSYDMRYQLASLITTFVRGNDGQIMKAIAQMGIVPESVDRLSLQEDISALRQKHLKLKVGQPLIGEPIRDFFNIMYQHGIHIPSGFVLLGKSLLTSEGILHELDPGLSLLRQAKPFSKKLIIEHFSIKNWVARLWAAH
ncbi:ABC1 kinase family protein [Paradesulfitobacterium aromaticivorans]